MGIWLVLTKALCFIAIIALGNILRRIGFFHEDDFHILSKIVLKITLPAAIVASFANKSVELSMLGISALGLLGGVLYIAIALAMNSRKSNNEKAFAALNQSGYNIGNFTLPFVQSFLGPVGVIVTSLFDAGNAIICLGGSYSAAGFIMGGGKRISLREILSKLLRSVPFDAYLIMTVLALLHVPVPAPVTELAGIIGDGNAFMAMLMIGVGFRLSGSREQLWGIVRIIGARYIVAIILSVVFYRLLPFPLEIRQTLSILVFAPIGSAAPAFTEELGLDTGLASAINSISILISICCIIAALMIVL